MKITERLFKRILREEASRVIIGEAYASVPYVDGKVYAVLDDMYEHDLKGGYGGDFGDLPIEQKDEIKRQTLAAVKNRSLTADSFHKIVVDQWKLGMPDTDNPPQQKTTNFAKGTEDFFSQLYAIMMRAPTGPAPTAGAPTATAPTGTEPTAGAPTAGTAGSTYSIARGDTLSQITLRFYGRGDPAAYKALAAVNRIADPNKIVAGKTLTIPSSINVGGVAVNRTNKPASRGATGTLQEGHRQIKIVWGR